MEYHPARKLLLLQLVIGKGFALVQVSNIQTPERALIVRLIVKLAHMELAQYVLMDFI